MHVIRMAAHAAGLASLGAWVVLALGRGRFWRAGTDEHIESHGDRSARASVAVVVPARNEAVTIAPAIASLVRQSYAGPLTVTLVDDDSSDSTGIVASDGVWHLAARERLTILPGRTLEPPWMGKLNALDAGVAFVCQEMGTPAYWLFTDADIEHDRDNVADLVAKATRDELDLVSLMVHLRCESGWERLLVPAFVFFFAKLYPFAWSNDPSRATAAAAGGCVLIKASMLERIGGLRAIKDRLIDDCALASAVKSHGGTTWIGLTSRTRSIREYGTLEPFWSMVKRSAFTQLGRSYTATLGATLGMIVLYVVPLGSTIAGLAVADRRMAAVGAAGIALMASLYMPTLRAYGLPKHHALRLPVAAVLYMTMTVDSALAHALGRGGLWKGRTAT